MSAFLTSEEHKKLVKGRNQDNVTLSRFWEALCKRVRKRIQQPGLAGPSDNMDWWYIATEYLSDAAMVWAIENNEATARWLRSITLEIVRRPVDDWVGPRFRDHSKNPPVGNLETAHLCWGVSTVYDLAGEIFTDTEWEEIGTVLTNRGIILCQRWLRQNTHLANWRGVMMSGMTVAAIVTGSTTRIGEAINEFNLCGQSFQPDGSYGESLQYANYLANAMMMAYEAIARSHPDRIGDLNYSAYARSMEWMAVSIFYAKPLPGWGVEPRPHAANFNDSALMFRPSGDLLLHIAGRCKQTMPRQAGLAQWLFNKYYLPVPDQGPHSLATFGMRNDWGFLTLPLLLQKTDSISPESANLSVVSAFSNGNILARDSWQGKTILAIQGGSERLYTSGHLHGDLNSFILTYNKERLLADPGHSCYRNLLHGLESSSQTHNTCTFFVDHGGGLGLQEDLAKARLLVQKNIPDRRELNDEVLSRPLAGRGRQLICERIGEVTAVGSEAHSLYGAPVEEYARFWLLAGSHTLFVVDRIRSSKPIFPVWNWLVNNRDGSTEVENISMDQLLITRNSAGLKIMNGGNTHLNGPAYGYVHDAYHIEPAQLGEGKPGSGLLYQWIANKSTKFCVVAHAFAFDEVGKIHLWNLKESERQYQWSNSREGWTLKVKAKQPLLLEIENQEHHQWVLAETEKEPWFNFKSNF